MKPNERRGDWEEPRDRNVAAPEPLASASADNPDSRDSSSAESPGRGGTYLLTWTTHGTWLPGDRRGFVSRVPADEGGSVIHNQPGTPYDLDMPAVRRAAAIRQRGPGVRLGAAEARACAEAFVEVAGRQGLTIFAGAVMANHVHLVVDSPAAEGARLLHLFKGVSARRLGQGFAPPAGGHWWTRHGSRRLLPDGRAVEAAVRYVLDQPFALVVFDDSEPRDSSRAESTNEPRDMNVAAPEQLGSASAESASRAETNP